MPEKKIIVRAWYWTGPPQNQKLRADFVGTKIRHTDKGVYLESVDAWGVLAERFHPYSNIEKIWEE